MEKSSLPQLLGEVTKDSVTGFVNDTRFAIKAPGVINDLNVERAEKGLPEIDLPSRARLMGDSVAGLGNNLVGGLIGAVVLKTVLKDIGKKIQLG